jgi:Bacterial Ig domain
MGTGFPSRRLVVASLVVAGAFCGALVVRGISAAPPCPPSGVRIINDINAPAPPDTTAPTVFVTSPTAGAIVSATVVVAACAGDRSGIAGVQFKLDGTNLSAEDVTAPYAVSWNTQTSTNGTHALTAVARDSAGNSKTSASVTVTVSNTTGSAGIAARYPRDVGIETDPAVVFVERFDETTLSNLFARWNDVLNGTAMSFSSDVPTGSPVATSLAIPWIGGGASTGGHLYRQITPALTDTLYLRYYIKYPTLTNYTHSGVWIGGYNPPLAWPNPQAGIKPTGSDRFSASAETFAQTGQFDHYDYWMGMHQSADSNYWGNLLLNNTSVRVAGGQWACVEHMIKLNNPVTASNGEHAIWINGVQISRLGAGFPNGTWSGGIFTQSPSGTPFTGFQWRNDANLNLNYIWLQNYSPDTSAGARQDMKFAHLVAAKSYIGCLAPGSGDTTPPTVSITIPTAAATVSGTTTVVAVASDNVGVAGVQLKVDGANVGSEATASPFSISWNTSSMTNGSHTLTAVARDAAGNRTTSAGVAVTVSNVTGSTWPNEPTGMTLLSDWGLDQQPPFSGDVPIAGSGGWKIVSQASPGSSRGWVERVLDASAPLSPSNVYDFVYPQGMVEGNAPGTVYFDGIGRKEVYVGFWWKASTPFDYGPDGNKIAFIFNGGGAGGGQQFMILLPDGKLHVLPEYPGDFRWRDPNVTATTVSLNVWHRIEWYTNVTTGTMKFWLDGVLQGSYTDVRNTVNFDMFQLSPTWGGNIGAKKKETDHYWFDHVRLSAR